MGSDSYESDSSEKSTPPIRVPEFGTADRQLKNYLFDNQELKEIKPNCSLNVDDLELDSDDEIFMLQCPKSFNPEKLIGMNFSSLKNRKIEFAYTVDLFKNKPVLSVIVPNKSKKDSKVDCDKLKLIHPVGKISIAEKFTVPSINLDEILSECNAPEPPKIKEEIIIKEEKVYDDEPIFKESRKERSKEISISSPEKSPKKSLVKERKKRQREREIVESEPEVLISPKKKKIKTENMDELSWLSQM